MTSGSELDIKDEFSPEEDAAASSDNIFRDDREDTISSLIIPKINATDTKLVNGKDHVIHTLNIPQHMQR